MPLTPEERERIYLEEKARLEAQEALSRGVQDGGQQRSPQGGAQSPAANQQKGCVGCLGVLAVSFCVLLGFSNPLAAVLTIFAGVVGIFICIANAAASARYGNPKQARQLVGIRSAVVLAFGVYGIYWQNSAEGRPQFRVFLQHSVDVGPFLYHIVPNYGST